MSSLLAKFSWSFVQRYRTTILLWALLLTFGALSYTSLLSREGFPAINVPYAVIQGTYLGEDPEQVDQDVVRPIAQAIDSIDEVTSYQSTAGATFFSFVVEFDDTITSDEGVAVLQQQLNDARNIPTTATYELRTIDASKFLNEYNLLFAVYETSSTSYAELEEKAAIASTLLTSKEGIETASVLPINETFTDPGTGISTQRQTSINRIGVRNNGETMFYPAVSVGVVKSDTIDDTQLYDSVLSAFEEFKNNEQIGNTTFVVSADFATQITTQINSLQENLLSGLLVVLMVVLLFISWRAAIVVAFFIPTVVATSMLGLYLFGFTLNTITLFALILTLGLFVDDATILVEAIDAHRKDKIKAKEIIERAVKRVGTATVAGTLTTVVVFTPMLYVSGILGDFITLLPITVIIALVASLLISLALIPFLSRIIVIGNTRFRLLDKISILVPLEQKLAGALSRLPLIARDNPRKGAVISGTMIGISVAAVAIGVLFFSSLNFQIFPPAKDSNALRINASFSEDVTIETVDSVTLQLDDIIRNTIDDELMNVTYLNTNQRGATIEIGLTPYSDRDVTSRQLIEELEAAANITTADISINQVDAGPPVQEYPFQMRIFSNDQAVLSRLTNDISTVLLGNELDAGGNPVTVTGIDVGGLQAITTTDQGRFATVGAQFENQENLSAAVVAAQDLVESQFNESYFSTNNIADVQFDFDVSQESDNAESFSSIGIGIVVALALMYSLLVFLYNSFSQPLLIFLAIPFSFFGVGAGLHATNNPLSFFVMIGFLGLVGIVVNNSILLVEYANQERANGADRHSAISAALKDRFRPLITTTSTTIVALLPLAISDPFWQPLAYTLIFGMASSVVLIVLSFPYYYLLFESIRDAKNRKFTWLQ